MKRRRTRHDEHENHERWLVSYADFITLLFAFFVVMYSVSSVNEGKYRVLSDSMLAAFSGPTRTMAPIQVGEVMRTPVVTGRSPPTSLVELDLPNMDELPTGEIDAEEGSEPVPAAGVAAAPGDRGTAPGDPQSAAADPVEPRVVEERVAVQLAPEIEEDLIEVRRKEEWIEIEMKTNLLFESGSARLTGEAIPVLKNLAHVLRTFPNSIQVEGFTDNVPIRTVAFPSNWELSAARAASVVHLFTKAQVRPERMLAIGYGEYHPVASNDTEAGRNKNRRVVIIIPGQNTMRQYLDLREALGEGPP